MYQQHLMIGEPVVACWNWEYLEDEHEEHAWSVKVHCYAWFRGEPYRKVLCSEEARLMVKQCSRVSCPMV